MTDNEKRYPKIVQPPRKIIVQGSEYTTFKFNFDGLASLQSYLKSNPQINESVFGRASEVESITGDESFAGKSYYDTVEQLMDYNDPKYKEFLNISNKTKFKNVRNGITVKQVYTVSGGIIRPEAIATGDYKIYKTSKIINEKKVININVMLGYNCGTNKNQVFNRAVILTNIIHALEKKGYNVKVNAFDISQEADEIIEIILKLKDTNKSVNYQALYKSLCKVEFLRRLMFRVMETSDVENYWKSGYGTPSDKEFCCDLLKLKKDDLYFDQPCRMDIYGREIEEDFENTIYRLNLEKKIDVKKEKVKIKDSLSQIRRD